MILLLILFTVVCSQQQVYVNNNTPTRSYFLVGNNPQQSVAQQPQFQPNLQQVPSASPRENQRQKVYQSNVPNSFPQGQQNQGAPNLVNGPNQDTEFNYGPVRSPLPQKGRIPQRKGSTSVVQSSSYLQPKNTYVKPVENSQYIFPERQTPLRECFYNPSGYVCCNRELNQVIINTYQELAALPNFDNCNTQRIANALQKNCEGRFGIRFETVVGLNDYAQRVNFRGNYVCKVEMGGRYMLAYGTPDDSHSNVNNNSPVGVQNKEQYKESHQQ